MYGLTKFLPKMNITRFLIDKAYAHVYKAPHTTLPMWSSAMMQTNRLKKFTTLFKIDYKSASRILERQRTNEAILHQMRMQVANAKHEAVRPYNPKIDGRILESMLIESEKGRREGRIGPW